MNTYFILLIALLVICIAAFFYYRKRYKVVEKFLLAPFNENDEQLIPRYTEIAVPSEYYDVNPPKGGEKVYFNEEATVKEVISALNLSTTGTLEKRWEEMFKVSRKDGMVRKAQVIKIVEEALNSYIRVNNTPFKVKGATLVDCVSQDGGNTVFYTKWDILTHRGNKLHGYAFEAVFMHIDDTTNLCIHSKHNAVFEDIVETITSLPGL